MLVGDGRLLGMAWRPERAPTIAPATRGMHKVGGGKADLADSGHWTNVTSLP